MQQLQHSHILQSCSLGLDVSVSRWSRDVFFKRLGLVSVSAKCQKVSVSSQTESQTSRSRLGLGPQRLVYKWTFKQIFQFLSFSYKTNCTNTSDLPVRHYNETNQISSVTKQAGKACVSTSMQPCKRMTDLVGVRLA